MGSIVELPLEYISNRNTLGEITAYLQQCCPISFRATEKFLTDERQKMGRHQVWMKAMTANYPQSKTNLRPR